MVCFLYAGARGQDVERHKVRPAATSPLYRASCKKTFERCQQLCKVLRITCGEYDRPYVSRSGERKVSPQAAMQRGLAVSAQHGSSPCRPRGNPTVSALHSSIEVGENGFFLNLGSVANRCGANAGMVHQLCTLRGVVAGPVPEHTPCRAVAGSFPQHTPLLFATSLFLWGPDAIARPEKRTLPSPGAPLPRDPALYESVV